MNGKILRHLPGNNERNSCPHLVVLDWLYRLFYVKGCNGEEKTCKSLVFSCSLLPDCPIHGICQTGCLCRGSTFLNRTGLSAMTRLSLRIPRRGQKMRDVPPQSCLLQSYARRGWYGMGSFCCRPAPAVSITPEIVWEYERPEQGRQRVYRIDRLPEKNERKEGTCTTADSVLARWQSAASVVSLCFFRLLSCERNGQN